jgi:hypothetical protein
MTINRLMNLPFRRLTENELNWLKNCTKDSREEVRVLAKEIYSQRFPHAERNQMKKQLYIKALTFTVNSCAWDEYGDEIPASGRFYMIRSEPVISMQTPNGSTDPVMVRLVQGKYSKLLKSLIHYYEIFCWDREYSSDTFVEDDDPYFEFDDSSESEDALQDEADTEKTYPTWSVSIKYTNGTGQTIQGTDDYLPDKVGELYLNLAELFEPEEEPDWEQDDFDRDFDENED